MSKLKITYVLNNFAEFQSGCFQVRINTPFLELKKRDVDVNYVVHGQYEYPDLDDSDIVMYSRHYGSDVFRSLWRHKCMGKKIVYDLDDDVWNIPVLNPAHETYKQKKKDITGMCNEADLVTVSTEELRQKVLKNTTQKNVVVIPNGLNLEKFKQRQNKKGLRIGWSGGSNHYEDINIILDTIRDLQKKYDFEFILQGLVGGPWEADAYSTNLVLTRGECTGAELSFNKEKMNIYDKFRKLKNFSHVPFYPPEMFPSIASSLDLDIGIIPVKGYEFDKSKSLIKYLEYTAVGTCAIASDVEPYKDNVLYTVANKYKKWYKGIEELINNEKLRKDLVAKQKKQLFPKYSIEKVCDNFEKELMKLKRSEQIN